MFFESKGIKIWLIGCFSCSAIFVSIIKLQFKEQTETIIFISGLDLTCWIHCYFANTFISLFIIVHLLLGAYYISGVGERPLQC